ncbi:hypothetical protein GCM10007301_15510 [Azorhizobium oxalatiphilum]|uniref:Uncharacterized protein n=1 Tax=Azorhizobium oxalatiphilum TaxID=980631 RepID=A0A917F6X6_9HYPH|nr:hypothetical protein [Azorhizobium oxalatiphilum]GGF56718.1 hypothetical protein GCM10007301_15510 [Azorhizobium oxalatiphilum]
MDALPLSRTYTSGSSTFDRVELRDPTYVDYRRIGPVFDVQKGVVLRDREAVFAYVDALTTSPPIGALAVLNLGDTVALEEHILGFFINARRSRASPMNSSSGSDGIPDTSIP